MHLKSNFAPFRWRVWFLFFPSMHQSNCRFDLWPCPVFSVIAGLKETEERYYLLVKESRSFREAAASCQLRGGSLATPTTSSNNRLMAACISEAGLSAAFIGLQASGRNLVREMVRHWFANQCFDHFVFVADINQHVFLFPLGGIKRRRGRPHHPPAGVLSLELTGGRLEYISKRQLELCAAAQQRNVEPSGVWGRHVFLLRVPQEQETKRRKRSPAFILAGSVEVEE